MNSFPQAEFKRGALFPLWYTFLIPFVCCRASTDEKGFAMSAYPVAYNGSETGTGGDSLTEDLNIYYNVSDCLLIKCSL